MSVCASDELVIVCVCPCPPPVEFRFIVCECEPPDDVSPDHVLEAAKDARGEPFSALKSSKAPTNYFTPNILRKSWSRLVVSVVHLDALAFPVAAT